MSTHHVLARKQLLGEDRRQTAQHVPAAVDDHRLQGNETIHRCLSGIWQSLPRHGGWAHRAVDTAHGWNLPSPSWLAPPHAAYDLPKRASCGGGSALVQARVPSTSGCESRSAQLRVLLKDNLLSPNLLANLATAVPCTSTGVSLFRVHYCSFLVLLELN